MSGRGLLVDFGGVLTPPVGAAFAAFEDRHGLARGTVDAVIREAYADGDGGGPIGRVERGELPVPEFEVELAARLGRDVAAEGLVRRLFGRLEVAGGMWEVVGAARAAGVRTCLLSNSWGTDIYEPDRLAEVFDAVVISAEVGVRKPSEGIFRTGAERVGLPLERCGFVDDLRANVEAAGALGIHAVHHTGDTVATAAALEPFLGVPLVPTALDAVGGAAPAPGRD